MRFLLRDASQWKKSKRRSKTMIKKMIKRKMKIGSPERRP